MTTTAFAAKRALRDLLVNSDDPALMNDDGHVAVWYGYEALSQAAPRELVWIGEVRWDDETPEALGNLRRDEAYKIVVTIEVHNPGNTQEESNDRAEQIMGALEAAVRDPRWSGIANIKGSGLVPQFLGEGADGDQGRGSILVSYLQIKARK